MGRFESTPPQASLPRGEPNEAAEDNPVLPEVEAVLPDLPRIPVNESMADMAKGHLPTLFDDDADEDEDIDLLM